MNLGKEHSVSAPRRAWTRQFSAVGLVASVGVLGLAGVRPIEGRADAVAVSDAPATGPDEWALDWPALDAVAELPVPPRFARVPDAAAIPPLAESATMTGPVQTATGPVAPPVETTTTTLPPAPPAPPVPPTTGSPKPNPKALPRLATGGPAAQAEVEAIADSTGWNWRAAGVRFAMGFYPGDCCHWGVYESAKSTIWIGPTAFAGQSRLRYVVLHELAHAWQYRQNRFAQFISDYTPWGFTTIGPALEAGADCLAGVWGAAGSHYWRCTADARALASRRLAGDWR